MVVGVGIASLNPITGLEEFGFFKKLARGVKKVVKKVIKPLAKVAQFYTRTVGSRLQCWQTKPSRFMTLQKVELVLSRC
jgi:hypothetical protein